MELLLKVKIKLESLGWNCENMTKEQEEYLLDVVNSTKELLTN
jgi:S-adenosylhomocysteine hydrolase